MSFELSHQQECARTAILSWYRSPNRKPWFYLAGCAGVGKSATITATTSSIKGNIIYAAPTGRAALVMAKKGCVGARTLHSLLYRPAGMSGNRKQIEMLRELRDMPTGDSKGSALRASLSAEFQEELKTLPPESGRAKVLTIALKTGLSNVKDLVSANPIFSLNLESDLREAHLLVIDEVSMCPESVISDALSFGVPVLVMGDLGQLPPVKATNPFSKEKPDYELTEIHRQHKDSPIIYLATLARQGKRLPLGTHGNCIVTRESLEEEALAADQIIVGRHVTRWATNDKVRQLQGRTGILPNPGEKVICRHNDAKRGLLNGDQFIVDDCKDTSKYQCTMSVHNEDLSLRLSCWKAYFHREEPNPYMKKDAGCFDMAQSITANAAQGGQWPTVYVRDESKYFRGAESKWIYTSVTRASEKVVVRV